VKAKNIQLRGYKKWALFQVKVKKFPMEKYDKENHRR
jgi:hypothetical protein